MRNGLEIDIAWIDEMVQVMDDTEKSIKETTSQVHCETVWHRGGPSDFSKRGGKRNAKLRTK